MKIVEEILWIADSEKNRWDYKASVEFVHSFGLKCDSVGWTKLQLNTEEKWNLLEKIGEEAKKQKMRLRCYYEKSITDVETDWYFIRPNYKVNNADYEYDDVSEKYAIKGYKIPKGMKVISFWDSVAVSEQFMNICKEEEFTGVSFAWVNDTGRYAAEPFFYMFSNEFVERPTTGGEWLDRDTKQLKNENALYCKQMDENGGNLSLINEIFDTIQQSEVPIMLPKDHMPDTDFASVSNDGNYSELLIRKEAAEKLISQGAIKPEELVPALYYDNEKHNLLITDYKPSSFLPQYYINKLDELYQKFLKKKKPEYVPTEKDTLSLLRKAKREHGDRFTKALKKNSVESLMNTILAPMAAYYKVSNGGELSDEVEYYPYEEIEKCTSEFWEELKHEEEFLEKMPQLIDSVVIGGTANGDTILLCTNGQVMRYDHEDPFLSQEWKSVFEFFYDNLEITVLN